MRLLTVFPRRCEDGSRKRPLADMRGGGNVRGITALEWLDEAAGPLGGRILALLQELDALLGEAVLRPKRGAWLLDCRRDLCERGFGGLDVPEHVGGAGLCSREQLLVQMLCGWHDADFRDVAHIGHGNLLIAHGSPQQRAFWTPRVLSGALVAIAATESHGGSDVRRVRTVLSKASNRLVICGEKTFISRIEEADVFVVFCRHHQTGDLTAVCVSADTPGLKREIDCPEGLSGWSWGTLHFDNVVIDQDDVLPGDGAAIFRAHFAYYRPLVAAIVVGAAARVWEQAASNLHLRRMDEHIDRVRDSALERLAAAHIALHGALLSALRAEELVRQGDPRAEIWSRSTKAYCVETAQDAAQDAAQLLGARGFRAESVTAKALRDIRAFLYADGMHDALLRSAGRELLGVNDLHVSHHGRQPR
ncbi:MAG TPA: acyl-CoA dehydrogenase family protein [Solirubrobacteraceae bacterium]